MKSNMSPFAGILPLSLIVALGCDSHAPTVRTADDADLAAFSSARPQSTDEQPEPDQDSDDGVPPGWVPMPGATCTFIDVRQRRVELVEGLRVTLRILADTTVSGNFFARVWLGERHATRLGDFDLERGEVTFFTVTLPHPGLHRLVIDVEANDAEQNHTQCDSSLMVEV